MYDRTGRMIVDNTRTALVAVFALVVVVELAGSSAAHELWIETDAKGRVDSEQGIDVCWGYSGDRESAEMLARQQDKLSGQVVRPDGTVELLKPAMMNGGDSFQAKFTPKSPGYHLIGSQLQSGILNNELHGIPPNTRIVMYGKSFTHVGAGEGGLENTLGFDLEIVPVTSPKDLSPGELVTVKLLFMGKPLGGRQAMLALETGGPDELPSHPKASSTVWSIEAHPDSANGEISLPLIASGRHFFCISYFHESPGKYEGEMDFASDFSHLQKGDSYDRTMYVSTFAFTVKANQLDSATSAGKPAH